MSCTSLHQTVELWEETYRVLETRDCSSEFSHFLLHWRHDNRPPLDSGARICRDTHTYRRPTVPLRDGTYCVEGFQYCCPVVVHINSIYYTSHMTVGWPSHSVQRLRSTTGRSLQAENWATGCREKACLGTWVMLSALSQMILARDALLRVTSWSGVNWPSLSYQNLCHNITIHWRKVKRIRNWTQASQLKVQCSEHWAMYNSQTYLGVKSPDHY